MYARDAVFKPHRSTTYVDAACCYRPSSVVCRSVCHTSEPCNNGRTDRDAVRAVGLDGPRESCLRWDPPVMLRDVAMATMFWLSVYGVHIGATWRMRLNRPCVAAMRPYVDLF